MTHIKMKHFLMVLCLCIFSISLQAQDLIVTGEGDSLNYKITKVKKDPISMKEIYPHFRLALTGGWSYLTARLSDDTPAEFKDYSKELKSGFHYDVDFSYYFVEQLGVGFKYHEFLSSNKMDNVYATYPDGSTEYGSMSDDIRINFIGPFFSTRFFNSTKKNCLLMDLGLGYMGYQDKTIAVSEHLKLQGATVGMCLNIGYDISISRNFALGVQVSLMGGTLSQLKVSNGTYTETVNFEEDQYQNLSRINLSVGLRFNK